MEYSSLHVAMIPSEYVKSRGSGPSRAQALVAQGSRLGLQFLQAQALKSRA
jgi:hypothetical protein